MRRLAALLLVLLLALAHCCAAHKINRLRGANENTWNCTSISKTMLVPGAIWQKMNCTSEWLSYEPIGPLTFNVVSADLSAPNLRVVPVMANQSVQYGLQSIPDMGSQRSSLFAGINGGFFWELYNPTFIDNVCLGKSRKDAETPPSLSSPQYGPGDTLLIIDGVLHGSNCHSILFDVPIVFVMNGTSSYIQKLPDGGSLPLSVGNALACGPNLVSFDPAVSNESFIDIPLNDFDPNVWEHAADTAIGLTGSVGPNNAFVADTFYMVTVDGYDSGSVFSPESGINSHELAHYMKYYLNVQMAMNMDQGGSTQMWIKGQPNNGVVSNAYTNDPGHGLRIVYNGIFLETVDNE